MHRLMKQAACILAGAALGWTATSAQAQSSSQSSSQTGSQTGSQTSGQTPTPAGTEPISQAELNSPKLARKAPVTYNNRYEVYGGIALETFQAGQNLPKRMNFGGIEVNGTYWATRHLGAALDFRGQAGTTPVLANPYTSSPLVIRFTGMAGVQYRGPKSQRFAIDYHAYGGVSHGDFTHTPIPAGADVGLYSNRTKPIFALGGSLDLNRSKNLAFRLSPDLILSHFGTETREFFAISAGVVYRFGNR